MGRIFLTRTGLHPWIKSKGMLRLETSDIGARRISAAKG